MTRIIVTPPKSKKIYEDYGYSPAVLSGDLMFVSGQVGIKPDGSVSGDPVEQISQAFANLGEILQVSNATFDDVIDLTAFFVDYKEHGGLARPVRDQYFGKSNPPNWTALGVVALAEPYLFEVKAIVRITAESHMK